MTQEALSGKQKRMMEAARLRYMEDCDNQAIADRLGISEGTVRNYFSQEDMDQFKRYYSDQERFRLEQSLQQDIRDGEQLANNLLARAIQHEDAKPSTLARASKLALENRKRKVELLQELGIIQKPKERKEIEDNSSDSGEDLAERMQEAYKELQEKKEVDQEDG